MLPGRTEHGKKDPQVPVQAHAGLSHPYCYSGGAGLPLMQNELFYDFRHAVIIIGIGNVVCS